MKKNFILPVLCLFTFILGAGLNNFALSENNLKIACVDYNKLILASKTIQQAQNLKEKQTIDMINWYDNASLDIEKQQTKENKQALIKKYEAQLSQKKKTINDNYLKEITKVNSQLNSLINHQAKKQGYSLVFRKDALIFGGDDITSYILPLVK